MPPTHVNGSSAEVNHEYGISLVGSAIEYRGMRVIRIIAGNDLREYLKSLGFNPDPLVAHSANGSNGNGSH